MAVNYVRVVVTRPAPVRCTLHYYTLPRQTFIQFKFTVIYAANTVVPSYIIFLLIYFFLTQCFSDFL